jgi:hypothetical protein
MAVQIVIDAKNRFFHTIRVIADVGGTRQLRHVRTFPSGAICGDYGSRA